jgi:hypothetical protein
MEFKLNFKYNRAHLSASPSPPFVARRARIISVTCGHRSCHTQGTPTLSCAAVQVLPPPPPKPHALTRPPPSSNAQLLSSLFLEASFTLSTIAVTLSSTATARYDAPQLQSALKMASCKRREPSLPHQTPGEPPSQPNFEFSPTSVNSATALPPHKICCYR